MTSATAKYRNPDAPPGYVRSSSPVFEVPIEQMERASIDDHYCHYVGIMLESPLFTDPDMTGLSDFELNSSDEEKDIEIEEPVPPLILNIKKEQEKDESKSNTSKEKEYVEVKQAAVEEVKRVAVEEAKQVAVEEVKQVAVVEVKKVAVAEVRKKGAVEEVRKEGASKKGKKDEDDSSETPKKNVKGGHCSRSKVKKELIDESRKRSSKRDKVKKTKLVADYPSSPEFSDSESSITCLDSHSRRQHYKRYSRSPSPLDYTVKEEVDGVDFIHGCYNCEICHITMNSLCTYQTHVNGKRHQKNLKVKNMAIAVQTTSFSDPDADLTKYPKIPPGVIRTKVREKAIIQELVERQIRICPGLQNVTEIQGVKEIQYYCGMCDAVCSDNSIIPHLSGFKHRLNSLEHFRPDMYDKYKDARKQVIDRDVPEILRSIQKKEGLGRIVVEKEVMSTDNSNLRSNYAVSRSLPSTSSHGPDHISFKEVYDQSCMPDTSKSDFYCKICESHMNSSAMWESHIRGKRHLSNIKKAPGAMPSKTRTIRVPNARAFLLERLNKEVDPTEPVVGLDHIQETQIQETNSEMYNCFLCGACLTSIDIIDHLLSMKHRIKYLEHIDFVELNVIHAMRDQNLAYSVVRDMCEQVQKKNGPGQPTVHVTKNKLLM